MRHALFSLAALSLLSVTAPVRAQALRYDGLYQSGVVDWIGRGRDAAPVWSYLRFYPDGTVVNTSTPGRPEQLGWLRISNESLPAGTVEVEGNRLSFSVREGNNPAVDYEGEIVGDRLHLRIHSHINGYRGEEVYVFVPAAAGAVPPPDRE